MEASSRRTSFVATALLSVAAFAVSPILVGDEDWVRHTMSEAGSQGVDGAWLGNLAFLLFGLCSWVATRAQPRWVQRGGGAFATCMIGVAAFSTRAGATGFDAMEDHLHSIFATAMGFAFAGTVVARAWID